MTAHKKQKQKTPEKVARAASLAAATGAVACGVGCVLPVALPAVALAGAGSLFAWLGSAYYWATALAAAIVTGSWVWIGLQSIRSKARPASSTLTMMGIATAILGLAILWSRIEPLILHALHS